VAARIEMGKKPDCRFERGRTWKVESLSPPLALVSRKLKGESANRGSNRYGLVTLARNRRTEAERLLAIHDRFGTRLCKQATAYPALEPESHGDFHPSSFNGYRPARSAHSDHKSQPVIRRYQRSLVYGYDRSQMLRHAGTMT